MAGRLLLKGRSDLQKLEILSFRSSSRFRKWLAANHRQSGGVWLRICKKDAEESSVTYAGALDEALCFGWIDGQKQRHDESSWLQKFTPRRPKSGWSKINTQHAERLIQARRMKFLDGLFGIAHCRRVDLPGGKQLAERAAANRTTSADLASVLASASAERMEAILAMLAKGQPLH